MSNGFQGSQQGGGAAGATQFFGQMMTMPFSAFVYGMQLMMQMMQGMQQMTGQGVGAAGGSAGGAGAQATGGADAYGAGTSRRTTREEDRAMSDQNWSSGSSGSSGGRDQRGWGGAGGQGAGGQNFGGGQQGWGGGGQQQGCGPGEQGWSVRDECRDSEPCDQLRLIRYKVLFLKRDLEVAFPEQEELVAEDMPKDGFISWKIAEFIQAMARGEVKQPGRWKEKGYPSNSGGGKVEGGNVLALPDKDKRFLRVYCQVLECYDRERMNYERDQIDVLKEIRDAIKSGL